MEDRGDRRATYRNDRRRIARWPLGTAVPIAVVTLLWVLASSSAALGVCCVCESDSNQCFSNVLASCDQCANVCGPNLRACCPDATDCSAGGADSCTAGQGICNEVSTAPGFCDGTCAGTTTTPGIANTAPLTSTTGLVVAALLLAAVGALALARQWPRWLRL